MPLTGRTRKCPLTLEQAVQVIERVLPELKKRFNVSEIAIVGSYARNEQTEDSDIDIVVDFSEPIGWEVVDLKDFLEQKLDHSVDLILKGGMLERPRVFNAMKEDMIHVKA